MTFVNERIGHDYRTFDVERNITLTYHGTGGAEWPHKFQMSIKDEIIEFEAWVKTNDKKNAHHDVTWEIIRLKIPDVLKNRKDEIKKLIEESLDVCGFIFRRDRIDSIFVDFKKCEMI